jgi:DNA-directed RNA polymerase specialized sigma24 family protein
MPSLRSVNLTSSKPIMPEVASAVANHPASHHNLHQPRPHLPLSEQDCGQIVKIARYYARRHRLNQEGVEDCAQDFLVRCLEDETLVSLTRDERGRWPQELFRRLHRLADNHAHDWARRRNTYNARFGSELAEALVAEGRHTRSTEDLPLSEQVIRQAWVSQVLQELNRMPEAERELLDAYCRQEISAAELATRYRVTEAVIWQRVRRSRLRLAQRLQATGWIEPQRFLTYSISDWSG